MQLTFQHRLKNQPVLLVLSCFFSLSLFSFSNAIFASQLKESPSCQTPRLAEVGWADIEATTGLTTVLLEGLGYRPKTTLLSVPVTFASLKNKDIDIFLGNWQPTMKQDIQPYLKEGSIEVVGSNLKGAKYTLAVPQYAFQKGLKNFADLQKFKEQLDGKIYGIEAGNDGNRLIQSMIDGNHFGLKGWKLIESSEQGMLTQVSKLIQRKKWVVFLGWAPHPMNKKIPLAYLEGGEQFFGPNQGESAVSTVVRKNFLQECPNLGRLLKNLQFDINMENELMGEILEKKQSAHEAAKKWMIEHPLVLAAWLKEVKAVDGQKGLVSMKKYLKIP